MRRVDMRAVSIGAGRDDDGSRQRPPGGRRCRARSRPRVELGVKWRESPGIRQARGAEPAAGEATELRPKQFGGGPHFAAAYLGSVQFPQTQGYCQSATFLALSGTKGLHGAARTGPSVFHTMLNWPSSLISPMTTGLWRWWFFSSILM